METRFVFKIRKNHDMMRDLLREEFEEMYERSKRQMLRSKTMVQLLRTRPQE